MGEFLIVGLAIAAAVIGPKIIASATQQQGAGLWNPLITAQQGSPAPSKKKKPRCQSALVGWR